MHPRSEERRADARAYVVPVPAGAMVARMARPPGIPQRQPSRTTARSGNREKIYGYVLPELYDKARKAADLADLSIGAYLERLIAADAVDADGRPLWAPTDAPSSTDQQRLPLAG